MPELKRKNTDFFQPMDVDMNSVAYKDKKREKIRQEKLATYRATGQWPTSKANAAPAKKKESWSEKKAEKVHKKEKKQIKLEKKEKRKKKSIDQEDWDEMARDARLLKKFKKRKVINWIPFPYLPFLDEFENATTTTGQISYYPRQSLALAT